MRPKSKMVTVSVYTPFRVGSQSWQYMCEQAGHRVLKDHGEPGEAEVYIFPLRDEVDICVSAFFHDLGVPEYPFYLEGDITAIPVPVLVEHFMTFDWSLMQPVTYTTYLPVMESLAAEPIDWNFADSYCIVPTKAGGKIGLFKFQAMRDEGQVRAFMHELGLGECIELAQVDPTSNLWCADIYTSFKEALRFHPRFDLLAVKLRTWRP